MTLWHVCTLCKRFVIWVGGIYHGLCAIEQVAGASGAALTLPILTIVWLPLQRIPGNQNKTNYIEYILLLLLYIF